MKNILFFGGSSLLATMWYNCWKNKYKIYATQHQTIIGFDSVNVIPITNLSDFIVKNLISKYNIEIVINCIGLTNVEKCEKTPSIANFLNAEIPSIIAKSCFEKKIFFVHVSTDHLSDGNSPFSSEEDTPNPINQYAVSKLKAENLVLKQNPDSLIIRTNFFGNGPTYKPSFSDIIIKALKKKEPISLFNDVFFNPVNVIELSSIVAKLIKRKEKGVFNISSNERVSKYKFGILIAENLNLPKKFIIKGYFEDRRDLVNRPYDMSLSNKKISDKLNYKFHSLQGQIKSLIYSSTLK
ncbi:SDR family oxidoreductase [Flavobacteriaceae bacterium]|nr:SDR family oxidoreductase [Flavobacteriaceae bacterium]